jgi:hypothetical protein
MGYELINIVIAALGFATLIGIVDGWGRLRAPQRKYNYVIEEVPRTAMALTKEYLSYQNKNVIRSITFTVPVSILSSILAHDFSAILVGLSYCAIIGAFLTLTKYRVEHRYFGSTAVEAAELIKFIATKTSDGNPPHSRHVSIPVLDQVSVEEVEINAAPEGI